MVEAGVLELIELAGGTEAHLFCCFLKAGLLEFFLELVYESLGCAWVSDINALFALNDIVVAHEVTFVVGGLIHSPKSSFSSSIAKTLVPGAVRLAHVLDERELEPSRSGSMR